MRWREGGNLTEEIVVMTGSDASAQAAVTGVQDDADGVFTNVAPEVRQSPEAHGVASGAEHTFGCGGDGKDD